MRSSFLEDFWSWTERLEASDLYRTWAALFTLAAVLERKVWVEWFDVVYPNMYVIFMGEPAVHKGSTLKKIDELLLEIRGIHRVPDIIGPERIIHHLSKLEDYFWNPETDDLMKHSSMTVLAPELTVFVKVKNPYHISLLTDLYDARRETQYSTFERNIETISNVCMNLIGATTPDSLRAHLPPEAIASGFGSRIMFVHSDRPTKKKSKRKSKADEKRESPIKERMIRHLKLAHSLRGPFDVEPAVEMIYEKWRDDFDKNPPPISFDPNYRYYLGRREAHHLKVSMAASVARDPTDHVIRVPDFLYALEIIRLTEELMPRALGKYRTGERYELCEAVAREVCMSCRSNGQGLTFNQLLRIFIREASSTELQEYLAGLVTAGAIKTKTEGNVTRYVEGPLSLFINAEEKEKKHGS